MIQKSAGATTWDMSRRSGGRVRVEIFSNLSEAPTNPAFHGAERNLVVLGELGIGITIEERGTYCVALAAVELGETIVHPKHFFIAQHSLFDVVTVIDYFGRIRQTYRRSPPLRAPPVDRAIACDGRQPGYRTCSSRLVSSCSFPDGQIDIMKHILGDVTIATHPQANPE